MPKRAFTVRLLLLMTRLARIAEIVVLAACSTRTATVIGVGDTLVNPLFAACSTLRALLVWLAHWSALSTLVLCVTT